jgi:hypothetical protein
MLTWFLFIYSLGLTGYLIKLFWTRNKNTELDAIWKAITSKADPSAADLTAMAEVAKARQSEIHWFERSVSTIGIVAFFSMIIATTIQTINSAKIDIDSSNVKQEIKVLESQRVTWKKLLKSLSEVIVLKQLNGRLEESEKDVLRQRLQDLEDADSGKPEDERERLKLYLALGRHENASALVEKSSAVAADTTPENLILLAETSYVDGAKGRANTFLNKFEPTLSKQPVDWQVRFFVLKAALSAAPTDYAKDVAAVKGIDTAEAEQFILARVEQLKQRALQRATAPDTPRATPGN